MQTDDAAPRPADTDAAPAQAEGIPPLDFLTVEDARALRHGLRGIHSVEVRQIGDHPSAGPEVTAFAEAEGLEVSFRQIEWIVPAPKRRFVFRYANRHAELTVTPGASL